MAIVFTIDNNTVAAGIQQIDLDETAGIQNTDDANGVNDPDPDDEVEVTYGGGILGGGLDANFLNYLNNTLVFPSPAAKTAAFTYAASIEGASSSDTFITVAPGSNQTVGDLFFSVDPSLLNGNGSIVGLTTLAGEALYFHIDAGGDTATVTTSAGSNGRIVAALYLDEDDDGVGVDHLAAQVQFVTFEALSNPSAGATALAYDDPVNFTDALQVSATANTVFNFGGLHSSSNLVTAVGSYDVGLLVTGRDLNVTSGGNKDGLVINGGSDPSDAIFASQGGSGPVTIGLNGQQFTGESANGQPIDGATAVFTLVNQFQRLLVNAQNTSIDSQFQGSDIRDVSYNDFVQTHTATIFLSQVVGANETVEHADLRVQLFNADGDSVAAGFQTEETFGYIDKDYYNAAPPAGNVGDDSAFADDIGVALGWVKVTHLNGTSHVFNGTGTWNSDTPGVTTDDVTVTFEAATNSFKITGLKAQDMVEFAAAGAVTTSFNRFTIQALATSDDFDLGGIGISQGTQAHVGVGSHLVIDDDGPDAATAVVAEAITLDETRPEGSDTAGGTSPVGDASATANYADNFATPVYGTDGAGSTVYSLFLNGSNVASGLFAIDPIDTTAGDGDGIGKGNQILLNLSGNTITGSVGATNYFTIALNSSTGMMTFTQLANIWHPTAGTTYDEAATLATAAAGDIQVRQTVTDADGDSDTASLNLGQGVFSIQDDGPSFSAQISGAALDQGAVAPVSNTLYGVPGADTPAHYTIDKWIDLAGYDEVPNSNTSNVTKVDYYITGSQTKAFSLEVFDTNTIANPDDNSGMYTFTNFLPPPMERLEFDFTYFPSGSHLFGVLIDADEQSDLTPDSGLLVVGRNVTLNSNGGMITNATDVIHTSQGGQGPVTIGVGDQMFKPGAGAVFVYLDHPDRNSAATQSSADGLTSTTADDADALGFAGTIEALGASIEVVQLQGSDPTGMKITAYDLTDDGAVGRAADPLGSITKKNAADDVGSPSARNWMDSQFSGSDSNASGDVLHAATLTKINTIKVYDTGAAIAKATFTIDTTTGVVTDNNPNDSIFVLADHDGNDNTHVYDFVTVHGFADNDTIQWSTDAVHDAVLIEGYSGQWDVGGFNIEQGIDTPDIDLAFSVAITDADGDVNHGYDTTFDDFKVILDGTGTFNDNTQPTNFLSSYDISI